MEVHLVMGMDADVAKSAKNKHAEFSWYENQDGQEARLAEVGKVLRGAAGQ